METLASGLLINSGADGPAALVISEKLRTQIASLGQEIENTTNLISKYNTASSTVSGLRGQLTELRTLAVEAANEGGNNAASQEALDRVGRALAETYNNTVANAEFNGTNLLDGSEGSLADVALLEGFDLSSGQAAEDSIDLIDQAISDLDAVQIDLGSTQKYELKAQVASLRNTHQNLVAAESQIRDVDMFRQISTLMRDQIRLRIGLSLMAHSNMNSSSILRLFGS